MFLGPRFRQIPVPSCWEYTRKFQLISNMIFWRKSINWAVSHLLSIIVYWDQLDAKGERILERAPHQPCISRSIMPSAKANSYEHRHYHHRHLCKATWALRCSVLRFIFSTRLHCSSLVLREMYMNPQNRHQDIPLLWSKLDIETNHILKVLNEKWHYWKT